jgi:hypothetical protein
MGSLLYLHTGRTRSLAVVVMGGLVMRFFAVPVPMVEVERMIIAYQGLALERYLKPRLRAEEP